MNFKSKEIIKNLEEQIENGYSLPIFKGYIAVNKRGVEKLIDDIYENLPKDIFLAKEFLKKQNCEIARDSKSEMGKKKTIYDFLKEFDIAINNTISFPSYIILNIREIEKLINQIYDTIPEEINKAEVLSKQ